MTVLYLCFDENEAQHRRKLAGIMRFARTKRWKVVPVSPAESRPGDVGALIARFHPAGFIVESSGHDEPLPPRLFGGMPVVRLDPPGPPAWRGATAVCCDNAAVARAAFAELSAGSPPCFAAVPSLSNPRWSAVRVAAFAKCCAMAGIPCRVFKALDGEPASRRIARLAAWLPALPRHSAIFAANDRTAHDIADALRDAMLNFPRDFTVLGVDGTPDGEVAAVRPELSSLQLDFELAGYLAAKALGKMTGSRGQMPQSQTVNNVFGPLLVVRRESTRGWGRRDPHVMEAVEIIRREACEGLTAAALTARMPVSRKHFERRFREAMGHSVLDEILHVRLQAALDMLSLPEPSISAIASFCGFGTERELQKLFRRRMAMSMRQWRANRLR